MASFYARLARVVALAFLPISVALAQTGGVGIGTTAPDASAALDIVSGTKGALLPRLTAAGRLGIASPAAGLIVFQTDSPTSGTGSGTKTGFWYNSGTAAAPAWLRLTDGNAVSYDPGTGLQVGPGVVGSTLTNSPNATPTTSSNATSPYYGSAQDQRTGFLLRAADLLAAGYRPGRFTSLGFSVTNKLSTGPFQNFSIKMANTSLTALPTTYPTVASTTVFTGTVTTVVGLNTHTFSTPFVWDGTSNLFIDICFDNATNVGSDDVSSYIAAYSAGSYITGTNVCAATANNSPTATTAVLYLSQAITGAYILPATSGSAGQVLTQQANGAVTFQTPQWTQSGSLLYPSQLGSNVGIGTNTPGSGQKLDVNGNAAVRSNLTVGGTMEVTGTTNLYYNALVGGKLGVRVGTPQQSLDVNGGILARASEAIGNQGAYLQWNRSGNDGETWLLNQKGGGNDNAGIRFGKSDATNKATEFGRFIDNGNFGVGDFSGSAGAPTALLDVNGTTRLRGLTTPGVVTADAQGNLSSASASGSFILNQTTPQTGSFNVSGAGTVGGLLTAGSARISNLPTPGVVTTDAQGNLSSTSASGSFILNQTTPQTGNFNVSGNGLVGGSVGIGTSSPNAAAALDVSSTSKGALLPRLSQSQRNALTTAQPLGTAQTGLLVYNTDTKALNAWDGTKWTEALNSGAGTATVPTATTTFAYTGAPQTYTVPAGVYKITVTASGAAGGDWYGGLAGAGAQVQATLTVVPGEVLTVNVGGQGGPVQYGTGGAGGWNGGGSGTRNGAGGGGATDLRRAAGGGSTGDYLSSRNALLVAAGGGGADQGVSGGGGGQPSPGGTGSGGGTPGGGATQAGPGTGRQPGANNVGGSGSTSGTGGGGGYYGGGGGSYYGANSFGYSGGGGGSSWVMPAGSSAVSYGTGALGNGGVGNGSLAITESGLAAPVLNGVNITGVPGTWDVNGSTFYHLGNVGIGTSTPSEKLEVGGNASVTGNLAVAGAASVEGNSSAGGNVGIGTTAPATRLSISPSVTEAKITLYDSGNATDHFGFGVSGNQLNYHVLSTSDQHVFYAKGRNGSGGSAIELMRIQGNGRVGIGTAAPTQALDVSGNAVVSGKVGIGTTSPSNILDLGTSYGNTATDVATKKLAVFNNTNGSDFYGVGVSGSYLHLFAGATSTEAPGLSLSSGGNVGIGTTSPASRLDVAGSLALPHVQANANLALDDTHYTVRCITGCSQLTLPSAAGRVGRIYVLINSQRAIPFGPTNAVALATTGGQVVFDDVSGSNQTALAALSRLIIQSDGNNWVVLLKQ